MTEGSTYHQFAQADVAVPRNRFSDVSAATVIGAGGDYPAAGSHQRDPSPDEEPLGLDNPALEFSAVTDAAEQLGDLTSGDVAPPSPFGVERRDVRSPPFHRRRL